MSEVRRIVTLALEERTKANIKVRQPLSLLTSSSAVSLTSELQQVIADEVNVKSVQHAVLSQSSEVGEVHDGVVSLDLTITPELRDEGYMRELMRAVQDMRKEAGLMPQDRILLTIDTSEIGKQLVERFMSELTRVVGADTVVFCAHRGTTIAIDEHSFVISVAKV
jgi:isoleucyl-tRNA synthetase